jgi:hypothetical protein
MGATTLSITTFNITTFNINSKLYFTEVVMLIVEIIKMSCCGPMLNVIMLGVIMLNVVAPLNEVFSNSSKVTMIVVFSNKN